MSSEVLRRLVYYNYFIYQFINRIVNIILLIGKQRPCECVDFSTNVVNDDGIVNLVGARIFNLWYIHTYVKYINIGTIPYALDGRVLDLRVFIARTK